MTTVRYSDGLPIESESFLIEKYDSFITSCHYISIHYPTYKHYYLSVYDNNELTDILVFGNNKNTALCYNSLSCLNQEIIEIATQKIIELFPEIKKIKIDASYKCYQLKKSFLIRKSDDYILILPTTLNEYNAQLGSKTRKHIKARIEKLSKDFSSVKFSIKQKQAIERYEIDKIIEFNRDRMKSKGKISELNDSCKEKTYKYAQQYGCVAYLELDGELIAGSICTQLNKSLFFHIIGHNNNYSKYNVGEACAYLLIQYSIENKLTDIHFLWGESELKKRFLAKPHELFSYFIYRSYSLNYLFEKIDYLIVSALTCFEKSKVAKPLKKAIFNYKKNRYK